MVNRKRLTANEAMRMHVRELQEGEGSGSGSGSGDGSGALAVAVDPVGVIEAGRSASAMAKHDLAQAADPLRLRTDGFPPGWRPRRGTLVTMLFKRGLLEAEYVLALEKAVAHAEAAFGGHSDGLSMAYCERVDTGQPTGRDAPLEQTGSGTAQATFRMMMERMMPHQQRVLAELIRDYLTRAAKGRAELAEIGRKYIRYRQPSQLQAAGAAVVKGVLDHVREFYGISEPKKLSEVKDVKKN